MPATIRGRDKGGFNHLRHGEAIAKGGPEGVARLDGIQKITRFDDDLVLIAGAMPRPLTE